MELNLAWMTLPQGGVAALVHRGGVFRQVVADRIENIPARIESVLVAEFRLGQDEARELAGMAGLHAVQHFAGADLVADELNTAQEENEKLKDELAVAIAERDAALSELASMKAIRDQANAENPMLSRGVAKSETSSDAIAAGDVGSLSEVLG